jgi:ABC-2 type transport system ATP-binding protein
MVVLLTTHLLDEADRCDRLLLLHEGARVREGSPAELKAAIGGEVVLLRTREPGRLMSLLAAHSPVQVENTVRVEVASAHRFAADTVEQYPDLVESVEFRRPTLEDVFFAATGAPIL